MMLSNFNVKIINLFIALCQGCDGIIPILRNHGYSIIWIEYPFNNTNNNTVKPEIIIGSSITKNTVLIESKSGGNIEYKQYENYMAVNSEDLTQRAFIDKEKTALIDIIYVIPTECLKKTSLAFETHDIGTPLISISSDKIKREMNSFNCKELNDITDTDIDIIYSEIPMQFYPFDSESEEWLIAEKTFQIVITFFIRNKSYFTVIDILRELFTHWDDIGAASKKQLKRRVIEFLSDCIQNECNTYFVRDKQRGGITHEATWQIIDNPLNVESSKKTAQFKKLQKVQKTIIERMQTTNPQLDLFEKTE